MKFFNWSNAVTIHAHVLQCDITNEYSQAMMNLHSFQVWKGLMRAVEWNKKEELVADQALRHLKVDHSTLHNRPHSYSRNWTRTNLEWRLILGISLKSNYQ